MSTDVQNPANRESELLRLYLAGRNTRCPNCGYDIRDLASDTCPECREWLMLTLRGPEPKMTWWLAAVIAASGGLVFTLGQVIHLLWSAATVAIGIGIGDLLPVMLFLPLQIMALKAVVTMRQRFFKAKRSTQSVIAGVCWVLTLATIMGYFALGQ